MTPGVLTRVHDPCYGVGMTTTTPATIASELRRWAADGTFQHPGHEGHISTDLACGLIAPIVDLDLPALDDVIATFLDDCSCYERALDADDMVDATDSALALADALDRLP